MVCTIKKKVSKELHQQKAQSWIWWWSFLFVMAITSDSPSDPIPFLLQAAAGARELPPQVSGKGMVPAGLWAHFNWLVLLTPFLALFCLHRE